MKEDKRKLKDSMQEWLEVFKYPALQRTSYDRLEVTAVAQIYPKLGNKAINKITIEDIQNTINDVMISGLSYSTARKTYLLLAEYFRYLEQNGIIEFNPVNCVEMMKKAHYMDSQGKEYRPSNETVTVFTAEEIERLRKEAFYIYKNGKQKHTQPGAYFLILNTGLRRGELCGLLNSDIDMNDKILHVRRSVKEFSRRKGMKKLSGQEICVGLPKTSTSVRDIPLNNTALDMINRLRKERWFGTDSPLVPDENGGFTKPIYLFRRFQRLQKSSGFTDIRGLHALRHTFATTLINGVVKPDGSIYSLTVKEVANLLGHTTSEITELYYVKRDDTRLRSLTDKFNL